MDISGSSGRPADEGMAAGTEPGGHALDRVYRRWMRAYPRSWRADRQEEVLGVLLDVAAGQGRTAPTRRERLDLLGHGLATRIGLVLPGERTRAVAASGALVAAAVLALSAWVFGGWMPVTGDPLTTRGPAFLGVTVPVVEVLSVLALVAAAVGRHRVARTTLLVAALLALPAAALSVVLVQGGAGLVLEPTSSLLLFGGLGSAGASAPVLWRPRALPMVVVALTVGVQATFGDQSLFLDFEGTVNVLARVSGLVAAGLLAALVALPFAGRHPHVANGLLLPTGLLYALLSLAQTIGMYRAGMTFSAVSEVTFTVVMLAAVILLWANVIRLRRRRASRAAV